jgi:hypothetical protein
VREQAKSGKDRLMYKGQERMKLRHAAALAAMGWYLVSPPQELTERGAPHWPPIINYSAPLSAWNRAPFPEQNECEDYKYAQLQRWRTNLMPDPGRTTLIEALDRSFCIDENDQRLKTK